MPSKISRFVQFVGLVRFFVGKTSTRAMVNQAVGYDAGKRIKGRKRFLTVDTLGLVLRVYVMAASVPEREGGKQVLQRVHRMGTVVSRLHTIWAECLRGKLLPAEPPCRWWI